jgi:hypothetical protein
MPVVPDDRRFVADAVDIWVRETGSRTCCGCPCPSTEAGGLGWIPRSRPSVSGSPHTPTGCVIPRVASFSCSPSASRAPSCVKMASARCQARRAYGSLVRDLIGVTEMAQDSRQRLRRLRPPRPARPCAGCRSGTTPAAATPPANGSSPRGRPPRHAGSAPLKKPRRCSPTIRPLRWSPTNRRFTPIQHRPGTPTTGDRTVQSDLPRRGLESVTPAAGP